MQELLGQTFHKEKNFNLQETNINRFNEIITFGNEFSKIIVLLVLNGRYIFFIINLSNLSLISTT